MYCRVLLATIAITCTFQNEIIALTDNHSTTQGLDQIKDVVCVLLLSGLQKEDLDNGMVSRLKKHNIHIDDIDNKNSELYKECLLNSKANHDKENVSFVTEGAPTPGHMYIEISTSDNDNDQINKTNDLVYYTNTDTSNTPNDKLMANLWELFKKHDREKSSKITVKIIENVNKTKELKYHSSTTLYNDSDSALITDLWEKYIKQKSEQNYQGENKLSGNKNKNIKLKYRRNSNVDPSNSPKIIKIKELFETFEKNKPEPKEEVADNTSEKINESKGSLYHLNTNSFDSPDMVAMWEIFNKEKQEHRLVDKSNKLKLNLYKGSKSLKNTHLWDIFNKLKSEQNIEIDNPDSHHSSGMMYSRELFDGRKLTQNNEFLRRTTEMPDVSAESKYYSNDSRDIKTFINLWEAFSKQKSLQNNEESINDKEYRRKSNYFRNLGSYRNPDIKMITKWDNFGKKNTGQEDNNEKYEITERPIAITPKINNDVKESDLKNINKLLINYINSNFLSTTTSQTITSKSDTYVISHKIRELFESNRNVNKQEFKSKLNIHDLLNINAIISQAVHDTVLKTNKDNIIPQTARLETLDPSKRDPLIRIIENSLKQSLLFHGNANDNITPEIETKTADQVMKEITDNVKALVLKDLNKNASTTTTTTTLKTTTVKATDQTTNATLKQEQDNTRVATNILEDLMKMLKIVKGDKEESQTVSSNYKLTQKKATLNEFHGPINVLYPPLVPILNPYNLQAMNISSYNFANTFNQARFINKPIPQEFLPEQPNNVIKNINTPQAQIINTPMTLEIWPQQQINMMKNFNPPIESSLIYNLPPPEFLSQKSRDIMKNRNTQLDWSQEPINTIKNIDPPIESPLVYNSPQQEFLPQLSPNIMKNRNRQQDWLEQPNNSIKNFNPPFESPVIYNPPPIESLPQQSPKTMKNRNTKLEVIPLFGGQRNKIRSKPKNNVGPITIQTNDDVIPMLKIPVNNINKNFNQVIIVTTNHPMQQYTENYDHRYGVIRERHHENVDLKNKHKLLEYLLDDIADNEDSRPGRDGKLPKKTEHKMNYEDRYTDDYSHEDSTRDIITYDRTRDRNKEKSHEKLESFYSDHEQRSSTEYKRADNKNLRIRVAPRKQVALGNLKKNRSYDDSNFKSFLNSQQKVNRMLEKILATKHSRATARSVETV